MSDYRMTALGDYIKIISNGSQLFVDKTECFLATDDPNTFIRPTLKQFCDQIKLGDGDFLGKHTIEYQTEADIRKLPIGTVIWDVEWCEPNEFYFEYCCEPKKVIYQDGKVMELEYKDE